MKYSSYTTRTLFFGVCAGLLGTASLAQAQEQGFIEYEVQRGDTCIKIARKVYGEGDLCYDLMAGSNDFDEKFRIYPGQKLKLPTKEQIEQQRQERVGAEPVEATPAPSDGPDARLKSYRGDVTARSPDASDWEKASRNKDLWRRWKVNSASRSSASVFFVREKATLRMRENTLVVIYGQATTSAPSTARHAVLEQGALATRLGELSGGSSSSSVAEVEVETPSSVVTTKGGDALVSVVEGNTTLVANHTSPKTKVRGNRKSSKSIDLPKNMGTRVEKGKDPTPPKPLPSPPAWDQKKLSAVSMAGKSKINASWASVKDAVVWRVEVWRSAAEKELIDVKVLDAKIREVAFENFDPGDYELRIATIDTDGFESVMSEPMLLEVKELLGKQDSVETLARHAQGKLYLGEELKVASGMDCAFGGRRMMNQSTNVRHTGTHRLTCVDDEGNALPEQIFVVEPNNAALTQPPPGKLALNSVEEIHLKLDYPIEDIDLFFSEGFAQGGPARQQEDGTWIIPVLAEEPDREGELRVGTPGILGATLLKVPLVSASKQETIEAREPVVEKPFLLQVGAYIGSRDITSAGLTLSGREYEQGLRLGFFTGFQWRRHLVLDVQFDTGRMNQDNQQLINPQAFGISGAVAYRIGPWAIKPYVRAGGGIEFIPDIDANMPRVFGGGGLVWTIERRVDLRLDIYQNLFFDGQNDPGLLAPGATFGFAGTF